MTEELKNTIENQHVTEYCQNSALNQEEKTLTMASESSDPSLIEKNDLLRKAEKFKDFLEFVEQHGK
jgi:hypothetical protein